MNSRWLNVAAFAKAMLIALTLTLCAMPSMAADEPAKSSVQDIPSGNPFVAVMVDQNTLEKLGPFPFDRTVYAKFIDRAVQLKAKAIVLNFILNDPRGEEGDRALATAMTKTKVVLAAALSNVSGKSDNLPDRFKIAGADITPVPSETSGLLPLPRFVANAYAIGFAGVSEGDRVPIIERYRGDDVKSLWTCCIELAADEQATVVPGKSLSVGRRTLALDKMSMRAIRQSSKTAMESMPLADFMKPEQRPDIAGRIVILGWNVEETGASQNPARKMTPSPAFCDTLLSLWNQIEHSSAK